MNTEYLNTLDVRLPMVCLDGTEIHPVVIRSVLVRTRDVLEYEVLQTRAGIDVVAVADHGLDVAALREHLVLALATAGLADPEVAVRTARNLHRHPLTGKLPRFVPLHRGT